MTQTEQSVVGDFVQLSVDGVGTVGPQVVGVRTVTASVPRGAVGEIAESHNDGWYHVKVVLSGVEVMTWAHRDGCRKLSPLETLAHISD